MYIYIAYWLFPQMDPRSSHSSHSRLLAKSLPRACSPTRPLQLQAVGKQARPYTPFANQTTSPGNIYNIYIYMYIFYIYIYIYIYI